MIFLEDVAGFTPGTEQETRGIILEGRRLLDAIIDLRVPSMTLIIRNAFGGAYAAYNSHFTGADAVFAMPHGAHRGHGRGPAAASSCSRTRSARSKPSTRKSLADGTSEPEARRARDAGLPRSRATATSAS